MPQPNKIPRPFADSGDKNTIPESSGALGFASWQEGFPAITGTPFSQGGVAPKRADFNGIFNALSLATLWQQQGGFYAYDATTDYEVGNVIEYNNDLYKCLTANGPSSAVKAPTDTTVWSKVMTAADAAALYLPLSGGTMTGVLKTSVQTKMPITSDAIQGVDNTGRISVCGGKQHLQGARALLYGIQDTSNPGDFALECTDGSITKTLRGKPDGTLKWDSSNVWTEAKTKDIATGTLTKTLDPTSQTYSRVYAQNGVGYFFLSGAFPSVTSGAATYDIYTSSIKPQKESTGYCICQGTTSNNMHLIINSGGTIKLRTFGTTVPSNTYFWGAIAFPLA